MIDHNIILQILYHNTLDRQVYSTRIKKEFCATESLIFFPADNVDYGLLLSSMDSIKYMQRLAVLYSTLWNCN